MKLEKLIKQKSMRIVILCIVAIVIATGILAVIMTQKSFYQAFEGPKEIRSYADLNNAKYNNAYVKFYFTEVYDTGFEHTLDGRVDGYYLDFDIDGYMLFALVKKEEAQKILNGTQKYIEGELCEFKEENKRALDAIIKDYADRYKEDGYTESDIKAALYPKQIDNLNYSDNIGTSIFLVVIYGLVVLFFVVFGIKAFLIVLNPSKKIPDEKIAEEYEEGNFTEISKGLYYSQNYIFSEFFSGIQCRKISEMAWIYKRVVKQNMVTTFSGVVISFTDGKCMQVAANAEEALEKLYELNHNVLVGFTPENSQKYREAVKEYKEQRKGAIR